MANTSDTVNRVCGSKVLFFASSEKFLRQNRARIGKFSFKSGFFRRTAHNGANFRKPQTR